MKIRVVTICYSHARTAGPPPLSSRIASRLVQPTTQPFGHVGSSSGGGAASPNDHWHSCVSKFGLTRRGRPSSEKSCCAGSLHELRHIPTVHDVTPVCNKACQKLMFYNPNLPGVVTRLEGCHQLRKKLVIRLYLIEKKTALYLEQVILRDVAQWFCPNILCDGLA